MKPATWDVERSALRRRIAELSGLMARSVEVHLTENMVYTCTFASLGSRGTWARRARDSSEEWRPITWNGGWPDLDRFRWRAFKVLCDDTRALVEFSPEGRDAYLVREFDLESGDWKKTGFAAQLCRGGSMSWIDRDTVLITWRGADDDPSMLMNWETRIWRRGEPLDATRLVYASSSRALKVTVSPLNNDQFVVCEHVSWTTREFLHVSKDRVAARFDVPRAAKVWIGPVLTAIVSDSRTCIDGETPSVGSLLAVPTAALLNGRDCGEWLLVCAGKSGARIEGVVVDNDRIVFSVWDVTGSTVRQFAMGKGCVDDAVCRAGPDVSLTLASAGDGVLVHREGFLETRSTHLVVARRGGAGELGEVSPGTRAVVHGTTTLRYAVARDGVAVPYYAVVGEGKIGFAVVSVYGGFGAIDRPAFDPGALAGCVEGGGAYVLACVRGGGTLGPGWHDAGRGARKLTASKDALAVTIAVQEQFGIPCDRIGLIGGSNGALVLWNAIAMSEFRFGAAVLQVPLLDVSRLEGDQRAWLDEYSDGSGSVGWLRRISPLTSQLPALDKIPPMLLLTSLGDDRVGEDQARRFAQLLADAGAEVWHRRVLGGHRATLRQDIATASCLSYEFLREHIDG